jgi:hypothetical protein
MMLMQSYQFGTLGKGIGMVSQILSHQYSIGLLQLQTFKNNECSTNILSKQRRMKIRMVPSQHQSRVVEGRVNNFFLYDAELGGCKIIFTTPAVH